MDPINYPSKKLIYPQNLGPSRVGIDLFGGSVAQGRSRQIKRVQGDPKMSQERAKTAQERPEMAQEGSKRPKTTQDRPKTQPKWPKRAS